MERIPLIAKVQETQEEHSDDERDHHDDGNFPEGPGSWLSDFLFWACLPLSVCCCCYSVESKTETVIMRWGAYERTERAPGIHMYNPWGATCRNVSVKFRTHELPNTKVIDGNGNPLIMSGVIVYQVLDAAKSVLNVDAADSFVWDQAQIVLKRVVARFPYEPNRNTTTSLKTTPELVHQALKSRLQKRVGRAGVHINSFDINEISYSPEIAQGMLKRQQAGAVVEARKVIVEGAVEIIHDALISLGEKGVELDPAEKARMVSNMLVVITSESSATPTIPLSQHHH